MTEVKPKIEMSDEERKYRMRGNHYSYLTCFISFYQKF